MIGGFGKGSGVGKYDHLERDALIRLLERRGENTFLMLRKRGGKLDSDGDFSIDRLKWT